MKKAKINYEFCIKKAAEAQAEIETAQHKQKDAAKRLESAEKALKAALITYQSGIAEAEEETMEATIDTSTADNDESKHEMNVAYCISEFDLFPSQFSLMRNRGLNLVHLLHKLIHLSNGLPRQLLDFFDFGRCSTDFINNFLHLR